VEKGKRLPDDHDQEGGYQGNGNKKGEQ